MIESYVEQLKERDDFKISPLMLMRMFHVNFDMAQKICHLFWMKRNREMRELARNHES